MSLKICSSQVKPLNYNIPKFKSSSSSLESNDWKNYNKHNSI